MREIPIDQLDTELAEMSRRLQAVSLKTALENVAAILGESFQQNFSKKQGSTGSAWPARKDKKTHPLLQETGALLGATQTGGPGHVEQIGERDLAIGVNKGVKLGGIPGAAVHNFGYPDRNIPQREFLYASETTLDRAAAVLADGALETIFGKE